MLEVHVEIPFGCEAELRLPRSGREPERLLAGNYDYRYMPERDYRKTFDENTPLRTLAQNEDAMAILLRLTPALAGMAKENNPEFSGGGLADYRGMGFLPVEPEKLEQAIAELKELIVWKE
jgi:alpha-L-rhamnosidase